ncbi:hypothetical protein SUGI_0881520 [Cryptomeria japonica]|nr:hypothetical protein SUGI_0881520 [Cryptomeria japonica]
MALCLATKRGPGIADWEILKLDDIEPRVNILAAWPSNLAPQTSLTTKGWLSSKCREVKVVAEMIRKDTEERRVGKI